MSEAAEHERPEQKNGTSRRAALKAGVGIGVGLVAWSGPTITSLGGTPAYAQGCTFVVRADLSGGCRNTDQSSGCTANQPFRYHSLSLAGLPSGYAVTSPIPEGTCCGTGFTSTLTFPAGITCQVTVDLFLTNQCHVSGGVLVQTFGPESDGSLNFMYPCFGRTTVPSNSSYNIVMACNTTGAPVECLA